MSSIILFFILISTVSSIRGQEGVTCLEHVDVQVGVDAVIRCNISGTPVDFFWFRGDFTSGDTAIVSSGSGTANKGAKYTLAENGTLVINRTDTSDDGLYTVRVVFSSGRKLNSMSYLASYIKPSHRCPVIDGCGTCTPCSRTVNEPKGRLTCSIPGARPAIDLVWEVLSNGGMVLSAGSSDMLEDSKVSWNTSAHIEYAADGCGGRALLKCSATDNEYLLDSTIAEISIHSVPCSTTATPGDTGSQKEGNGIGAVIAVVVVVGVIFLVIAAVVLKRRYKQRSQDTSDTEMQAMKDSKRNRLVKDLVIHYQNSEDICVKPSAAGDTTKKRKNTRCTITYPNSLPVIRSSKTFFGSRFRKQSRVLIVVPIDHGGRTIKSDLLDEWCKSNHDYLLLYIPTKKLQSGKKLFQIVEEQCGDVDLSGDDIEKVCRDHKCLILLGSLETDEQNAAFDGEAGTSKMLQTISMDDLLGDSVESFRSIPIWEISREKPGRFGFEPPYTEVAFHGVPNLPV